MRFKPQAVSALILAATLATGASAHAADTAPKGWLLAGTKPQNYTTGVDTAGTAFLTSKPDAATGGFGTLMQFIKADNYAGKRIRLRASVRSENVTGWAGLWMRIDKNSTPIVLDNMQSRAIHGTTQWQTYDVVLDVPSDATTISFGALLDSAGSVWLNHLSLDIVGEAIPTTAAPPPGQTIPSSPVNLDFRVQ